MFLARACLGNLSIYTRSQILTVAGCLVETPELNGTQELGVGGGAAFADPAGGREVFIAARREANRRRRACPRAAVLGGNLSGGAEGASSCALVASGDAIYPPGQQQQGRELLAVLKDDEEEEAQGSHKMWSLETAQDLDDDAVGTAVGCGEDIAATAGNLSGIPMSPRSMARLLEALDRKMEASAAIATASPPPMQVEEQLDAALPVCPPTLSSFFRLLLCDNQYYLTLLWGTSQSLLSIKSPVTVATGAQAGAQVEEPASEQESHRQLLKNTSKSWSQQQQRPRMHRLGGKLSKVQRLEEAARIKASMLAEAIAGDEWQLQQAGVRAIGEHTYPRASGKVSPTGRADGSDNSPTRFPGSIGNSSAPVATIGKAVRGPCSLANPGAVKGGSVVVNIVGEQSPLPQTTPTRLRKAQSPQPRYPSPSSVRMGSREFANRFRPLETREREAFNASPSHWGASDAISGQVAMLQR